MNAGVTEDTSLDQFLDAGSGDDADSDGEGDRSAAVPDADGEGDAARSTVEAVRGDEEAATDTAPAAVTTRYDPDGVDCPSCGERVQRRWHDDGAFVCGACKEW